MDLTHHLLTLFQSPIHSKQFSHAYLLYTFQSCQHIDPVYSILNEYIHHHYPSISFNESFISHCPDIYILPSSSSIKIHDIDAIQDRIKHGPSSLSHCFVVIPDCDLFTQEAANAFLKTLEDPLHPLVFFLTSQHIQNVLPTIKSRCLSVFLPPSSRSSLSPPSLSLSSFLSLSFSKRLSFFSTFYSEKPLLLDHLNEWVHDAFNHRQLTVCHVLLDAIYSLQFNCNLKLQLDALSIRLSYAMK